jgi:type IV pilus assembly protein PilE
MLQLASAKETQTRAHAKIFRRGDVNFRSHESQRQTQPALFKESGFSLTELMVVLVIVGVLVLIALPRLMPLVTKAKTTEAKLQLKQLHTLEQSYKFEHDCYSSSLPEIGFEQEKLVAQGGQARYRIEVVSADERSYSAHATSVVDFDGDGTFNVWVVDESGGIKEKVPD